MSKPEKVRPTDDPQIVATWRERVDQWRQSGMRASEFARREGFVRSQLTWWAWEFDRRSKGLPHPRSRKRMEGAAKVTFAPVTVVAPRSEGPIEVVLASCTLRIGRDFDESTLARVVRALGERP